MSSRLPTWRISGVVALAVLSPQLALGAAASAAPADPPVIVSALRMQAALRTAIGSPGNVDGAAAEDDTSLLSSDESALVAVGGEHTCAIAVLSDVWCWGANDAGQLGDGSTTDSPDPVMITAGSAPLAGEIVTALDAGRAHTCAAVRADEDDEVTDLWCWGDNTDGQLGDVAAGPQTEPAQIAEDVVDFATGADHTCWVTDDAEVWCAGRNDFGQVGAGTVGPLSPVEPYQVAGLPDISAIAAGDDSTCAVDDDGAAWCWGSDAAGQLGDGGGPGAPQGTPVEVDMTGIDEGFVQLDGGAGHMCGVTGDSEIWCWGDDAAGQLGDGDSAADPSQPVRVDSEESFVSVSAGGDTTCAVADTAQLYCWGANADGQLGTGDRAGEIEPAMVDQAAVLSSPIFDYLYGSTQKLLLNVAVGADRTCAADLSPNTYCWGNNDDGRLATGVTGDALVPAPTTLVPGPATRVLLHPLSKRLDARWSPPADTGAAPLDEYAAIALTGDGIEAIMDSKACVSRRPECTIAELTNGLRYSVFVGTATAGGVSWSAAAAATPIAPPANAPPSNGGVHLPVTGPAVEHLLPLALLLITLGVALTAFARPRRAGIPR